LVLNYKIYLDSERLLHEAKKKYMKGFYILVLVCLFSSSILASDSASFAGEYSHLSKLLTNVTDRNSAILYKSAISQELNRLKASQINGGEKFESLSEAEQKLFINKFQNNRNHCGYVTKVMQERRRILLNPETKVELETVLLEMP